MNIQIDFLTTYFQSVNILSENVPYKFITPMRINKIRKNRL